MATHEGRIIAVRQEFAHEKETLGWALVARESDLLPFNPPRVAGPQADGCGE